MKSSAGGCTAAAIALAAALGLSLAGPHRAGAAPEPQIAQSQSNGLAVSILSPVPHTQFTGVKPVEISAYYQGTGNNPISSIELYVDGSKAATKMLGAPEARGVVSFLIDAAALTSGPHQIVVRVTGSDAEVTSTRGSFIFAGSGGDMLGRPNANIGSAVDPANTTPTLSFESPSLDGKVEGTVRVRIKAGDANGQPPYVSFFVDRTFKTLKNYPPYDFEWDTTQYTNGFHTLEAFGYNESQNVGHATPIRVYINNPGGRTERRTDLQDAPRAKAPLKALPRKAAAPVRWKNVAAPRHAAPPALAENIQASASHRPAHALRIASAARLPDKFSALNGTPELSDPFVSAPVQTSSAATAKRGFKPMPAPDSGKALLSFAGAAAAPTQAAPHLLRMADAHLASDKLSSPFIAAPVLPGAARVTKPQAAQRIVAVPRHRITVHTAMMSPSLVRAKGQTKLMFNDTMLRIDRPIAEQRGLMFSPLRQIFEFQGGSLGWDSQTRTVTAKSESKDISLTIGDTSAMVNEERVLLQGAPYLNAGRTMVPLSFLPLALDVNVQYDAATGHLLITSKQ